MALSREEARKIGEEAGTKVTKPLKDKCLKIAWPFEVIRVNFIDEALTHSQQGLRAKEIKQELGISSAIVNTRFFIEQANKTIEEDLYKEGIITSEERVKLDKELKEIQDLVSTEKFGEARDKIAEADSNLWEMMLEKVVACECERKKPEAWKLIGTEEDRTKAEIWASKMREHGEVIDIRPTAKGYELWRKE